MTQAEPGGDPGGNPWAHNVATTQPKRGGDPSEGFRPATGVHPRSGLEPTTPMAEASEARPKVALAAHPVRDPPAVADAVPAAATALAVTEAGPEAASAVLPLRDSLAVTDIVPAAAREPVVSSESSSALNTSMAHADSDPNWQRRMRWSYEAAIADMAQDVKTGLRPWDSQWP